MYPTFRSTSFTIAITIVFLFMSGCEEEKSSSLFDPSAPSLAVPAITSVTPPGSAVAGIDTVFVQGTGFSPTLSDNSIFFNASQAQIIRATPTQLVCVAPLLVGDSVIIRAAVHGSYEFSNKLLYALKPAVAVFGDLGATELSTALTTDSSGNIYPTFSINAADAGLLKFSPAGVRTVYAPKTSGLPWTGLKMGPGGYVYGVRNSRAVFRYAPGGGAVAGVWTQVTTPTGILFGDIDFDQDGNVWGVGNNTNIYRIAPNKAVTSFAFTGNIHSVRVFDGYLYFAANTDAGEKIWRAQITAGNLGTPEIYFDFAAAYPQNIPLAITFSSDGDLYIGINSQDGIVVVTPSKSYYTPLSVYKQLFGTGVASITWGKGEDIYCSTVAGLLLKINVTGKKSAPYYGAIL